MLPLMQVKLGLLGRCAQCLRHMKDCHHIDRTCVDRVSPCDHMGPLTQEECRARMQHVMYTKLHDGGAMLIHKVVIAPWLRVRVPQQH